MVDKRDFLSFISPEKLFFTAAIFVFITLIIVLMIYGNMYKKKRLFFSRQKINDQLNLWISEALVEETAIKIDVPSWLELHLKKDIHRHYVVDSLISIKKNISGAASESISSIYDQLGLKQDSLEKLKSLKWHKKARGIYELYTMGQRDALSFIANYVNSDNEVVRMEAQVAIVGFKGFRGLYFLSYLSYPLNDWQQLKLLEQLGKLSPDSMPDLPLWLASQNNYVKLFALKLADIYLQFHVHDIVVGCLSSEKEGIRCQAIKTLGRIANENTVGILKAAYDTETNANKKVILKQLCEIGSQEDVPFLQHQLDDEDDGIKLEACRAIARCDGDGWLQLEKSIHDNPTLLSISRQIKYELSR